MIWLLRWLLAACALLLVASVYDGVQLRGYGAALIAAAVIGLFNAVLRPVLVILTLPVTVVTLGLFLFVINALLFWAAASVLDGFFVRGFGAALLGSVMYSLLLLVVDAALGALRGQRFAYAGIPVVVTYHPAYLLRNLPDKAKAWEDLLFARRVLRQGESATLL